MIIMYTYNGEIRVTSLICDSHADTYIYKIILTNLCPRSTVRWSGVFYAYHILLNLCVLLSGKLKKVFEKTFAKVLISLIY